MRRGWAIGEKRRKENRKGLNILYEEVVGTDEMRRESGKQIVFWFGTSISKGVLRVVDSFHNVICRSIVVYVMLISRFDFQIYHLLTVFSPAVCPTLDHIY